MLGPPEGRREGGRTVTVHPQPGSRKASGTQICKGETAAYTRVVSRPTSHGKNEGKSQKWTRLLYPFKIHPQPGPPSPCPTAPSFHPTLSEQADGSSSYELPQTANITDPGKMRSGFSAVASHTCLPLDVHATPTVMSRMASLWDLCLVFEPLHRSN